MAGMKSLDSRHALMALPTCSTRSSAGWRPWFSWNAGGTRSDPGESPHSDAKPLFLLTSRGQYANHGAIGSGNHAREALCGSGIPSGEQIARRAGHAAGILVFICAGWARPAQGLVLAAVAPSGMARVRGDHPIRLHPRHRLRNLRHFQQFIYLFHP